MTRFIFVIAALATVGTIPVQGQAQWEESQLGPGVYQSRLDNEDGAAIVRQCAVRGVSFILEFPEPLEETDQASVRSIPGARLNIAVVPVGDRAVQIVGGAVIETLRLLRDSSRFFVRTGGQSTTFPSSGSGHIVEGCLGRQEAAPE